MALVYDDLNKQPFMGRPVPYDQQKAIDHYLRHAYNFLYLKFIINTTDDRMERLQANKEIVIAQRKLDHWRRHPNFILSEALPKIEKLKRDWQYTGKELE